MVAKCGGWWLCVVVMGTGYAKSEYQGQGIYESDLHVFRKSYLTKKDKA